jgi:glycosyltransferase involved in cell wall biosynthesis
MSDPDPNRITLLLSSPAFLPARGGAELRFLRYLPGLQRRNLFCHIATGTPQLKKIMPDDKFSDWFTLKAGEILPMGTIGEVPVHKIRLPDKKSANRSSIYYRFLLSVCRDPKSRPNVLQLIADLPGNCLAFLEKMRTLGIPTLYAFTLPPKGSSNPIKRHWQRFQLRRNFNSIDCIITNSHTNRDQLVRLGVKSRVEVILNGVELKNFYPAADETEKMTLRCRLACPPGGKIIVTVGAVHPRKGTDLLLQAWTEIARELPDAHLFLIGMRHDRNNPKLKKFGRSVEALVGSSGAADRIHFSGYVPNVAEYLKAADLFLFPSRIEGMPNAMLEAMACGVPVVTNPFIGFSPDLGRPDEHFVLADHHPEAIAKAAVDVLMDSRLQQRLSQNARDWIVQTMDIEKTLDRYAALYREMASIAPKG